MIIFIISVVVFLFFTPIPYMIEMDIKYPPRHGKSEKFCKKCPYVLKGVRELTVKGDSLGEYYPTYDCPFNDKCRYEEELEKMKKEKK